jgi:hypothetical protein
VISNAGVLIGRLFWVVVWVVLFLECTVFGSMLNEFRCLLLKFLNWIRSGVDGGL